MLEQLNKVSTLTAAEVDLRQTVRTQGMQAKGEDSD
jgi:hypothetical protein